MDDDCSGTDDIGDGWTGVAGVWHWRGMAGVEGYGDYGITWWGVVEDGAGADDSVDGICSWVAEDEAGIGDIGGWGMSAAEDVRGVEWDDDGTWSATPLLT